ncbi:MAG: hypothetical protein FJZ01_18075 [Candidatus Sericytochromatia bacterium]|nr:hypothetical protein [Candidatus Tanganyikabacteria bacterium]
MRRMAIALAGLLAATTGCAVGVPASPQLVPDRTVLQAEPKKPTLEDLKGMIPEDLSSEEAIQTVTPQEGEDVAPPSAAEEEEGAQEPDALPTKQEAAPGERTVQQRFRGGFRGHIGRGMIGGMHRFGRFGRGHDIFFPRHRSFFRHRFWGFGKWWRPFWRTGALFYPVVYAGVPYYVQYCWNPVLLRFTPCEVVSAVI